MFEAGKGSKATFVWLDADSTVNPLEHGMVWTGLATPTTTAPVTTMYFITFIISCRV